MKQFLTNNAKIYHYKEVSSTQDVAFELIENGCNPYSIVFADYQTSGRGQLGRQWQATPNSSLMFSIILKPVSQLALGLLPIRLALAVSNIVQSISEEKVWLKWPNDLIVLNTKIGGMLCEAKTRNTSIYAVAGVGLNIQKFEYVAQENAEFQAGFLENYFNKNYFNKNYLTTEHSGIALDKCDMIKEILKSKILEIAEETLLVGHELSAQEIKEFNSRYIFHRKIISREYLGRKIIGESLGINEFGYLMIELENGKVETIISNL